METLKNIAAKVLLFAGVLLLLDGLFAAFRTNFNIGTILTLAAGATLAAYGIWHEKIHELSRKGMGRILKYIVLAALGFIIGMILFLAIHGMHSSATYDEDAVVVLGAAVHGDKVSRSLAHRLDSAAEYVQQNPEAVIVVSGGQGPQEDVTEASAMAEYLLEKGIDEERIIKEEKATSTYENFQYSKDILDSRMKGEYTCVLVTNDYHTYRAGGIAEDAGLKVNHIGARTDWWYTPASYLREILAVIKYWIFGY